MKKKRKEERKGTKERNKLFVLFFWITWSDAHDRLILPTDSWFLADEDLREVERIWGRPRVSSCMSVGGCRDPTELWTGQSLGWGWLGGGLPFLPPASFRLDEVMLVSILRLGFLTDELQLPRAEVPADPAALTGCWFQSVPTKKYL